MSAGATRVAKRLLDESRATRSMTWIMAIMLFLTVLAAALGLGMARAGESLSRQLAGRLTVQVVEPDPIRRDAAARAIVARLSQSPLVASAVAVDPARLAAMLRPWLGADGADPDLPVPAMIDVDLTAPGDGAVTAVTTLARAIAPNARVDRHAAWMSPVASFIGVLTWLAAGLVALMALATAAVVFLAAKSGLDTHRDTIGVLHMLGSTDVQVARLFQRRIARDTLVGGLLGAVLAAGVVVALGWQVGALGSDLASGVSLDRLDWIALALLPFAFALLATFAARGAVLGALRRVL
ncbi:MAG: FtsX-like permease family protein [Pseudomonadota bacterium]